MTDIFDKDAFPEEMGREKAAEVKHALQQMLASEGWALYISTIKQQQHSRFDAVVLQPLSSMDETLGQEYMKGEIQGLRMAVTLPQALIEACQEEIDRAKQQEAKGDQE